jgi:hypothetical protein
VADTSSGTPDRPSAYLLVAAVLVALQGLGMLVLAVIELASLSGDRLALGLTTAVFFGALAATLALCARGLANANSWARSPVVVAELLQLLTAWSFRGGETTLVAVGLAVYAVVVLVCVLHPASTRALADSPS